MTNEELERAVERLTEDAKRLGCNSSSAVVSKADLRLLLSERAELLAAVERMRGALESAAETESREANARLIASAPDLLEALQSLVANLAEGDFISETRIDAARAAIARATGEAA